MLIRICFIGGPFCPVPGLEMQAGVSRLGGECSPQLVVTMPRGVRMGVGRLSAHRACCAGRHRP